LVGLGVGFDAEHGDPLRLQNQITNSLGSGQNIFLPAHGARVSDAAHECSRWLAADGFDVVAIRVEDEGTVVGMVMRAPRSATMTPL